MSHQMSAGMSQADQSGDAGTFADYKSRYEQFKHIESQKNQLIEELLLRYDILTDELITAQHNAEHLESLVVRMRDVMQRDPFVLVLIDGNGLIFNNHFLSKAEEGGKAAAAMLEEQLHQYVTSLMPDIKRPLSIVARIYADFKGLGEACRIAGITASASDFQAFAKGFTRSKVLFDFVDVGAGKDRADEKIAEVFKLHLYDYHCRQIFLGCSLGHGYARLLEQIATNEDLIRRVTLIEGVPFEKELATLPFATKKLGNLFRSHKINVYGKDATAGYTVPFMHSGVPSRGSIEMANGSTGTVSPASAVSSRTCTPPITNGTVSWAGAAAKAASLPDPKVTVTIRDPNVVPRNRKGQRIDPSLKFDRDEFNRVKRIKLCNVHFLRQDCPYGTNCSHKHDYKPTKDEMETLKLVARSALCIYGSGCDDLKCMYGHQCPWPKNSSKKTGSNCIYGEDCKFPAELHNVDKTVVSTLTIRN